jgi:hypothetical protein
MTFMVVDTNSYDVLLGLDLLIKIGTIVDVEQGLIQVRHGPRSDVEVLPLTMMNMLQKLNSKTLIQADAAILENTHGNLDTIVRRPSLYEYLTTKRLDALVSDSDLTQMRIMKEGFNWWSQLLTKPSLETPNLRI